MVAAERISVSSAGVTESYCCIMPANALPGIWAIAFDGLDTGHHTIGFSGW